MDEATRGAQRAIAARTDDEPPMTQSEMLATFSDALRIMELDDQGRSEGVLVSSNHEVASLLQTFIAQRSQETNKLEEVATGGERAKFDDHDLAGWVGSFFTWWKKIKPHKFVEAAADAEPLGNQVKMAILGDWGTGLYGAPVCAQSIEKDPTYNFLMHLGDVYYSGDENEVIDRFLKFWPKNSGAISRALNSNHEMYTGGHAYFEQTLEQFGQQASYFAMQNDHWVLVGLDSGYKEHNLKDEEVSWLKAIIERADNRKVVLFSHHQPYSLLERGGEKLVSKLDDVLTNRKIFAWYWGHEHRCTIFDQHPIWGLHGRCVGHGGFPYFRDNLSAARLVESQRNGTSWYKLNGKNMVPGCLVLDGPNPYLPGEENKYGVQGYMTIEFNGEHLNEIVHTPDGTAIFERQLI